VAQPVLEQLQMHHADNYGWALACCAWHRDSAEDVLQEAYLRVVEGRARYGGKAALRTWFFSVIKHVAAEMQRRQKRQGLLALRVWGSAGVGAADAPHSDPEALSAGLEDAQIGAELRTALLQLTQRQRDMLHLVFYSELTVEEAATALGIGVGSARTHYHRGKARLGELLALEADDDALR
jgi:RNA polymerase sigma-70 factor (ECF subfamily)